MKSETGYIAVLPAGIRLRSWWGRVAGAVARKGGVTLADQGVVSVTNFLTGVIVARSGSREELGLYSLGFTVLIVLQAVQSSAISSPYTFFNVRFAEGERAAYTGSSLVHQLHLAAAAALLLAVSGALLARGLGSPGMVAVMPLLALATPFVLVREYGRQIFFSRLRFSAALLMDLVVAGVQMTALLLLAGMGKLSAAGAYGAVALACGGAVAVWGATARQYYSFDRTRILPDLRMNWAIGKWSLASGVASLAGAQLYPWLITVSRGVEAAGILAACMGVAFLANPLIIGVGNFLAPQTMHSFTTDGVPAVRRLLARSTLVLAAGMTLLCVTMFAWGDELLRLIYGARYAGFGLVVALLSLSQTFEVFSLPPNCGLFLMERLDVIFRANVIVLLVTVTAGFWLMRLLGPLGVAWGLLLGNLLSSLYRWVEYLRRIGSFTATGGAVPAGNEAGGGP
ncbi:lipopolysaccharide biosynthesis protein [Geobacter pickeringii]|uniref:Polysaccharide biosynthesis protein C-terminal domain-containing protein n=1 Tax=Geobacter pickeringii TaxID=345632 RepID=A0A0B5BCJ4_9BACT|nr:oligosaccharide flippase family protein [Geobacter pickeringii]AJE02799.1 hypothetical protein GPICK_04955 [Geobacter pickeringii]